MRWPFKKRNDDSMDAMVYCLGDGGHLIHRDLVGNKGRMAYERAKLLRKAEAKLKERIMNKPMPVEYRTSHRDDGNCKREVVVPPGFETVHHTRIELGDYSEWAGEWKKVEDEKTLKLFREMLQHVNFIRPIRPAVELVVGAWYEMSHDMGIHQCQRSLAVNTPNAYSIGGNTFDHQGERIFQLSRGPRIVRRVYVAHNDTLGDSLLAAVKRSAPSYTEEYGQRHKICPEHGPYAATCPECAKPFRITGAGWYRDEDGNWVKVHFGNQGCWSPTGESYQWNKKNLIARATDAQAKVLDSLG